MVQLVHPGGGLGQNTNFVSGFSALTWFRTWPRSVGCLPTCWGPPGLTCSPWRQCPRPEVQIRTARPCVRWWWTSLSLTKNDEFQFWTGSLSQIQYMLLLYWENWDIAPLFSHYQLPCLFVWPSCLLHALKKNCFLGNLLMYSKI